MAKIRVAQIKDLSLENGVITIGPGNTITPLESIAAAAVAGDSDSVLTGLTIAADGKTINTTSVTKTALLADYAKTADITGSATIASVANGVVTLKAGATLTNGVLANNADVDITLAKIATTGTAVDVTVAAGIEGLDATNVQAALAELAGDIAELDAAQLEAGSGIAISADHEISTTVTLNYDSVTNTIQLLDNAGGNVIGTVDAKAFLKDGMVSSATVVTNPDGQLEGTYIQLTFNTQDPVSGEASHDDIFINVTSLIDIYTAGNDGINVVGRVISHKTGVVTENTQKGAVSENTITVPVVKVDGYGHVIALTEATWTLPESTALESVSGAVTDFITVTVSEKDEDKNQQITATATIGSFETNGANGLATTDAVKEYVTNNAATQMKREVLNLTGTSASLSFIPEGDVAITQNGIDLNPGEYTVTDNDVTFTIEQGVGIDADDVFVAYYMYNPNTQL